MTDQGFFARHNCIKIIETFSSQKNTDTLNIDIDSPPKKMIFKIPAAT